MKLVKLLLISLLRLPLRYAPLLLSGLFHGAVRRLRRLYNELLCLEPRIKGYNIGHGGLMFGMLDRSHPHLISFKDGSGSMPW